MGTKDYFRVDDIEEFEISRLDPLVNCMYSRVIEKSTKTDESDVYGGLDREHRAIEHVLPLEDHINTSFDLLIDCAKRYGKRDHLGVRSKKMMSDGTVQLGGYVWKTYSETVELVKIIGTALTSEKDLITKTVVDNCSIIKEASFLGIWALNCPYWLLIDYACIGYGLVSVPMYETFGDEALLKIMSETKIGTICIDSKKLSILTRLRGSLEHLTTLIIFDQITENEENQIRDLGLRHVLLDDLVDKYKTKYKEPPVHKRSDISTIIYTSGTCGVPKGAVYTNEGFIALASRLLSAGNRPNISAGSTFISFLPLAHLYERFVEHFAPTLFCKIGYYSGNIKLLIEDIQALQPDILIGVPRVFTKVLGKINSGINSKPCLLRCLVKWVAKKKKAIIMNSPERPYHRIYDLVMKKIGAEFGGKLRSLILGSAAMVSSDIVELQTYLTAPVSEGWGATEVGVAFLQDFRDSLKGTIGGPLGGIIFKLRSVNELEYDARGTPPRGELLIKGTGFMLGYFLRPELTAEAMDKEGWYHTGDVVELLENNGLKILDRAKNFFKLNQGEYIAPEKLENMYINARLVEQIFVYGESTESHIVGIVVISAEEVLKWASSNDLGGKTVSELLNDEKLLAEVGRQFDAIAETQNLNSLERLKVFTLVDELFSTTNGLLTPTFKSIRRKIKARYNEEIKRMYGKAFRNTVSTVS